MSLGLFTASCALALILGTGCERKTDARRSNFVLITIDALRADRLTAYGYHAGRTPTIEKLAEGGILFERAFCDTTWTVPSMASVMTGTFPVDHGVRSIFNRVESGSTSIAQLLRANGYRTGAVVGSFPVDRRFSFDRGFDSYDDDLGQEAARRLDEATESEAPSGSREEISSWYLHRMRTSAYRSDEDVADRAIAWLGTHTEEPFFLWVHFFGPHRRHSGGAYPAAKDRTAQRIEHSRAYDDDVENVDHQVGRLMSRLEDDPRVARTTIILHADHGENLGERDGALHGDDLYDTTAHIPLIVHLPNGERAGQRRTKLARNVDIFPTIASLAGVTIPTAVRGRDLLSDEEPETPYVYLETRGVLGKVDLKGIRTGDWKLIMRSVPQGGKAARGRGGRGGGESTKTSFELYDLVADPLETKNVAAGEPERVARMAALLERYGDATPDLASPRRELDEEAKQKLRALGYLE
jgi:arylsulfatase A-like enzyme